MLFKGGGWIFIIKIPSIPMRKVKLLNKID